MKGFPQRWHLYIVDLEPRVGTKPGKQRPCLVIQPSEFAESGLKSSVVLPLTTKTLPEEAFPLRIRVPANVCGLERDSEIIVDQILAWDNALFQREMGILPEALQEQTKLALRDFLDLD